MCAEVVNNEIAILSNILSRRERGVTLVELIIASALSIAILAGMLQLMEGTKVTSKLNESLSNIHLTGHYSLDVLRSALRYRGFEGCKRPVSLDPWQEAQIDWEEGAEYTKIVAADFPIDNVAQKSLRGYEISGEGTWSPAPDADLIALRDGGDPPPRENSDVVSIYYVSSEFVNLSSDMESESDGLVISDDTLNFEQGDFVFVGDCVKSNIFAVSNSPGTSFPITLQHTDATNNSDNLSYAFGVNAQVRKINVDTYYVGDTSRKTPAGDEIYALYRFREGESTEIVEGIENLQVVYGEELPTGNIRFLSADDEGLNMRTVQTVQIGLLVYHHASVTSELDTRTYNLVGTEIISASGEGGGGAAVTHMGERYLRKMFTESIHMLNRS